MIVLPLRFEWPMESGCDLCSCDVTGAVVVVAVDDGAKDGAVVAIAGHVQGPSWDESGRFDPASEDLPGPVECSRADAVEVGPVAADWLPWETACFWLQTTEINPRIQEACRKYVQTLAAWG